MPKYKVSRFYMETIYVEADSEEEAYEEASYDSSSNKWYDVDDVELVEDNI